MSQNIVNIEGIGPAYGAKLVEVGLKNIDQLLDVGGTAKGRSALAAKTGIAEAHILRWVNHADLMRINGVGPQFAELLEAAGVDTVKELRQRNPTNLAVQLTKINEQKKLTKGAVSES